MADIDCEEALIFLAVDARQMHMRHGSKWPLSGNTEKQVSCRRVRAVWRSEEESRARDTAPAFNSGELKPLATFFSMEGSGDLSELTFGFPRLFEAFGREPRWPTTFRTSMKR